MSTAIVWFRRDLRLHDNPALRAAAEAHDRVIPLFVHAPEEETPWEPGGAARWWLHRSLDALDRSLRQRHSRLTLRRGPSLDALRAVIRETGADTVYWNRLYEPAIIARDREIKTALREQSIEATSFNAALLWEPWTIRTGQNEPYRVFTPFWKTCVRQPVSAPLFVPKPLPGSTTWPDSLALDELELLPRIRWYDAMEHRWQPGEAGAQQRLQAFCDGALLDYADERNRPDRDGVSRLSPHLHWGELSPRQVWQAVTEACHGNPLDQRSSEAYLREIGWREFAHHVLFHEPRTPERSLDERFEHYPWQNDNRLLTLWQQGRTGIPLVDAGMRQLWREGWMHNRVRMVVASFLTKNLRTHWRAGANWFWDTLVDADLASNTLGWQWTAGCGVDAAPYFRVFNPVRQAEQHDPDGAYIAEWLPELAELPVKWRCQPWATPAEMRHRAGVILGVDYPHPIVDLGKSRTEALASYETIKTGSSARR